MIQYLAFPHLATSTLREQQRQVRAPILTLPRNVCSGFKLYYVSLHDGGPRWPTRSTHLRILGTQKH